MKNINGGSFLSLLNTLGQLVLISIVWVLSSLPIVTLGASCCAMYYAVVKALRRDRGSLLPCFFSAFRDNFFQCLTVNMVYLCLFAVPAYFAIPHLANYRQGVDSSFYLIVGFSFLLLLPLCVSYPVISRFYHRGGAFVRFLLLLLGRHPLVCFSSALLVLAGAVVVMNRPAALMFVPGIVCYVQSLMLEKIFERYSDSDGGDYGVWYDRGDGQ